MSLGELTVASTDHGERIVALETRSENTAEATKSLGRKIDKLQNWLLGVMATALIHLLVTLLHK